MYTASRRRLDARTLKAALKTHYSVVYIYIHYSVVYIYTTAWYIYTLQRGIYIHYSVSTARCVSQRVRLYEIFLKHIKGTGGETNWREKIVFGPCGPGLVHKLLDLRLLMMVCTVDDGVYC